MSALEKFACKVSGNTVPTAMLAVVDFKAFFVAQGEPAASEFLVD